MFWSSFMGGIFCRQQHGVSQTTRITMEGDHQNYDGGSWDCSQCMFPLPIGCQVQLLKPLGCCCASGAAVTTFFFWSRDAATLLLLSFGSKSLYCSCGVTPTTDLLFALVV